jgi:lipopolysaccharide biosynthesis protein
MKNISVHLHVYYEDMGLYLLNKLSTIWNGKVYLSLINNNCANQIFITTANSLFSDIDVIYIDNKGTDQYGFFHSFKLNKDDTKWILYWHDKHITKKAWLDDITDIYCNEDNNKTIERLIGDMSSCGIVSSSKHRLKTNTLSQIAELSPYIGFENRQKLVRNLQSLLWLKELQYLFKTKYDIYNEEEASPYFTAGTVFLIRRDIVDKVHSVVHENFFENCYREDGDVGHALERFYFYASKCLAYTNKFI